MRGVPCPRSRFGEGFAVEVTFGCTYRNLGWRRRWVPGTRVFQKAALLRAGRSTGKALWMREGAGSGHTEAWEVECGRWWAYKDTRARFTGVYCWTSLALYSVSAWESLCVYELGKWAIFFFIFVLKVVVKYIKHRRCRSSHFEVCSSGVLTAFALLCSHLHRHLQDFPVFSNWNSTSVEH